MLLQNGGTVSDSQLIQPLITGPDSSCNVQHGNLLQYFKQALSMENFLPKARSIDRKLLSGIIGTSYITRGDANLKLAFCDNPKSGSTMLRFVFGYLADPLVCNISQPWTYELAQRCNSLGQGAVGLDAPGRGFTVFTIVRDPIARFISGWLDQCQRGTFGTRVRDAFLNI